MSTFQNPSKAHAAPIATSNRCVHSALWPWAHSMIAGSGVTSAPGSHGWGAFDARVPTTSPFERHPPVRATR